jgi:TPR repeat protein
MFTTTGAQAPVSRPIRSQPPYWYQAAAVAHVREAQWKLGKMLFEGDGVPKNTDAGLAWLTSAAIEGSTEAASYLHARGEPVPPRIYPNSYTIAAERAHQELEAAQTAQRQQAVRDLASLLVTVARPTWAPMPAPPPRLNHNPSILPTFRACRSYE